MDDGKDLIAQPVACRQDSTAQEPGELYAAGPPSVAIRMTGFDLEMTKGEACLACSLKYRSLLRNV